MKHAIIILPLTIALTGALGTASAEPAPLDRGALAQCAAQVQRLRHDSVRLNRTSDELEARRQIIEARSDALERERDAVQPDALAQGMAYQQRAQAHLAEAQSFNQQIARLRNEIDAVNVLKSDYDQRCAQKPYRRSDLDALPPEAQAAMRAGLSDIAVPYIDPAAR